MIELVPHADGVILVLVSGAASREKRFLVVGVSREQLLSRLQRAREQTR